MGKRLVSPRTRRRGSAINRENSSTAPQTQARARKEHQHPPRGVRRGGPDGPAAAAVGGTVVIPDFSEVA